ncbi:putative diacylglycerol kinase [Dirofilaria immitis]
MTSNRRKKREYFLQHTALSFSAPTRRKWYRKENNAEENCPNLARNMTSNRLIAAVATWHDIHASLMKLSLSKSGISSDEIINSSSSTSSSYSINSSINSISDDSLNGNYSSDENLDENLLNYPSRLSTSNLELRSLQLKEMFPGLSEHWRCLFHFYIFI